MAAKKTINIKVDESLITDMIVSEIEDGEMFYEVADEIVRSEIKKQMSAVNSPIKKMIKDILSDEEIIKAKLMDSLDYVLDEDEEIASLIQSVVKLMINKQKKEGK